MSDIICNNTTTFLARRLFDNGESLVCKGDTYKRVGTIEGLSFIRLVFTHKTEKVMAFLIAIWLIGTLFDCAMGRNKD
jgi:hypothetical protein